MEPIFRHIIVQWSASTEALVWPSRVVLKLPKFELASSLLGGGKLLAMEKLLIIGAIASFNGLGSQARLRPADGLILFTISGQQRLVFSDIANFRVRTVDLSTTDYTVRTLVGNGRFGTGTGSSAQVVLPRGITPCPGVTGCPSGNFVVADSANHRILMVQP